MSSHREGDQRAAKLARDCVLSRGGSPKTRGRELVRDLRTGKSSSSSQGAVLCSDRWSSRNRPLGGNVLSSQIDLQGPHSAEGFIGLTESLEIDQASLQPLLYDLEAGMPYLF